MIIVKRRKNTQADSAETDRQMDGQIDRHD